MVSLNLCNKYLNGNIQNNNLIPDKELNMPMSLYIHELSALKMVERLITLFSKFYSFFHCILTMHKNLDTVKMNNYNLPICSVHVRAAASCTTMNTMIRRRRYDLACLFAYLSTDLLNHNRNQWHTGRVLHTQQDDKQSILINGTNISRLSAYHLQAVMGCFGSRLRVH